MPRFRSDHDGLTLLVIMAIDRAFVAALPEIVRADPTARTSSEKSRPEHLPDGGASFFAGEHLAGYAEEAVPTFRVRP